MSKSNNNNSNVRVRRHGGKRRLDLIIIDRSGVPPEDVPAANRFRTFVRYPAGMPRARRIPRSGRLKFKGARVSPRRTSRPDRERGRGRRSGSKDRRRLPVCGNRFARRGAIFPAKTPIPNRTERDHTNFRRNDNSSPFHRTWF